MTMDTPMRSHETSCDILIVGAGPAGLAAALAAAPSGAAITLLDDNPGAGGQIWRDGPGARLPAQARALRDAVAGRANVRLLTGTRVAGLGGLPGDKALLLEDAERGWIQRWRTLILCTGARELLLPFPGWTLPGVTGAGGLQALLKAGLPVAGQRIVIAGSGPLLLAAADTARHAGAHVVLVAEQAAWRSVAAFAAQLPRWPGKLWQALQLADARYRPGTLVTAAHGQDALDAVSVAGAGGGTYTLACDRLACGFGLLPNAQLGQMLGCALGERQGLSVDALQRTSVPDILAAGECTGFGGCERALAQGARAGHAAVGDTARAQAMAKEIDHWQAFADLLHRHFAVRPAAARLVQADTLVCRCENVRHEQLHSRRGWIDAKLHTRCGMGACQGRVCGAAAQTLYGWEPPVPHHLAAPTRLATLAESVTQTIND